MEPRLRGVPESLRGRILAAVSPLPFPDALRVGGERLLAAAQTGPASRDTALTLLAADALMTFACEAMAEVAPERLGELR